MSSPAPPSAAIANPDPKLVEDQGETGDEKAKKIVTLADIRTLRNLYGDKTLKQVAKEAQVFPCRPGLLDRVSLYQGDITELQVDSIVNAANETLLGGGGIDGAIHEAAGPGLLKECRTLGGAKTGEAKITGGYNLPANHVIHAVGPRYFESNKDINAVQLGACYSNSLNVALDNNLKNIAFCCISTSIFAYPIEDATRIALQTTRHFLDTSERAKYMGRVIFVVRNDKNKQVYQSLLPQYFPDEPSEVETEPKKEEV